MNIWDIPLILIYDLWKDDVAVKTYTHHVEGPNFPVSNPWIIGTVHSTFGKLLSEENCQQCWLWSEWLEFCSILLIKIKDWLDFFNSIQTNKN